MFLRGQSQGQVTRRSQPYEESVKKGRGKSKFKDHEVQKALSRWKDIKEAGVAGI